MNYKQRLVELDADLDQKANAYLVQLSKFGQDSAELARVRKEWDEAEGGGADETDPLRMKQADPPFVWRRFGVFAGEECEWI